MKLNRKQRWDLNPGTPVWDAGIPSGGLTSCNTVPVPYTDTSWKLSPVEAKGTNLEHRTKCRRPNSLGLDDLDNQQVTICGELCIPRISILENPRCVIKSKDVMRLYTKSHFIFRLYNQNNSTLSSRTWMQKGLNDTKCDLSEEHIVKITLHRLM